MRARLVAVVAVVPLLVLVACGGGNGEVEVSLTDFKITLPEQTLAAGQATFDIRNDGANEHEMVIFQTDLEAADLPVANGEVDEGAPGLSFIGEVEGLEPGDAKPLTVTLTPGRYLFLCNEPGHFEQGMWTVVEVS